MAYTIFYPIMQNIMQKKCHAHSLGSISKLEKMSLSCERLDDYTIFIGQTRLVSRANDRFFLLHHCN